MKFIFLSVSIVAANAFLIADAAPNSTLVAISGSDWRKDLEFLAKTRATYDLTRRANRLGESDKVLSAAEIFLNLNALNVRLATNSAKAVQIDVLKSANATNLDGKSAELTAASIEPKKSSWSLSFASQNVGEQGDERKNLKFSASPRR